MKFFELLKNTKNLIIFAITCIVICFVGKYRDFDFVEIGSFKLSFDFMFFVALVGATVSSMILIWKILSILFSWIRSFSILKTLKNCTSEEKRFLYNRIFEEHNARRIDFKEDSYFYQYVGYNTKVPYRDDLVTKEKVLSFLCKLENKGILQSDGGQTMIIPQQVWDILVKNSDEIFKGLNK